MSWSIPCSPGRATRLDLLDPIMLQVAGKPQLRILTWTATPTASLSHLHFLDRIRCDNRHYCQAVLCNLESRDSRCAYVLQRSPNTAAVSPMASMTRPGGTIGAGVSLYRPITPMLSQHAKRLDPYMAPLIRLP